MYIYVRLYVYLHVSYMQIWKKGIDVYYSSISLYIVGLIPQGVFDSVSMDSPYHSRDQNLTMRILFAKNYVIFVVFF